MMNQRQRKLQDLNILNIPVILQETLSSTLSAIVWGRETNFPQINMRVIVEWFNIHRRISPKAKYGVLYAKPDISLDLPRFYQALFDAGWNCVITRQIASDQIAPEVLNLLGDEGLVIFDQSIPQRKTKTSMVRRMK